MKSRLGPLILVVLLSFANRGAGAGSPPLWGGLEPGPYDVGLQVLTLVDQTRFYGTRPSRPIQVSLWYPVARDSSRTPQTFPFADYVVLYETAVTVENREAADVRAEAIRRYRREWFQDEP